MGKHYLIAFVFAVLFGTATGAENAFNLSDAKREYAESSFEVKKLLVQEVDGSQRLVVYFSVPLNPAEKYSQFFLVTSSSENKRIDGDWIVSGDGRSAYFPNVLPDINYAVRVSSYLTAVNGRKLGADFQKQIHTPGLPPQVSFMMNGSILPAELARGLPIQAVNVNQIDVDFFSVDSAQMLNFLRQAKLSASESTWQIKEIQKNTKLVYTTHYDIKSAPNKRADWVLPVDHINVLKKPGIYFAIVRAAGLYNYEYPVTYFMRSDLGLSTTKMADGVNVRVTSLGTGLTLESAVVKLLDNAGRIVEEHKTDNKGETKLTMNGDLITVERGDYFTLMEMRTPALDLADFPVGGREQKQHEVFIYSARDLYRPGETPVFSAILRDNDGKRVKSMQLKAKFLQPDGKVAKEFSWNANSEAYYQTELALPRDAATGSWTIVAGVDGLSSTTYTFRVEEFLPERMELEINGPDYKPLIVAPNASIDIPVYGRYLYGSPAAGNKLKTRVMVDTLRELPNRKGFFIGDVTERSLRQEFELDELTLDEQGKTNMHIAPRWSGLRSPLAIKVTGQLFETGGRAIVRHQVSQVWPNDTVFAIRPMWTKEIPDAYEPVRFEIAKFTRDGKFSAHKNVDVELIRNNRSWYWYSDEDQWSNSNTEDESPVWSKRIQLTDSGALPISMPVEWGWYRLEVRDNKTGNVSSYKFFAGWRWYRDGQAQTRGPRPDQVALSLDKSSYAEGSSARLHIQAPDDGQAYIAVHGDRTLWQTQMAVSKNGSDVTIPIAANWNRHDLYVSVTVLRAGNAKASVSPKRSFGILPLPLDRESRRLQLKLEAPEKTKPSQTVKVILRTKNAKGPVTFTLAAVDVGVLQMTRFKTPDIHDAFFGQRRFSGEIKDSFGRVMDLPRGGMATAKYGGDADLTKGGDMPQSEVQILSYFTGALKTDAQGNASISIPLPEFNGRVRLMAVAYTDDAYGSTDREMEIASPVVTEVSMPRFMAPGDKSLLTVDLHNRSGVDQNLFLQIDSNDVVQLRDAPTQLALRKDEKKVLRLPLSALTTGQGSIKVNVKNSNAADSIDIQREWKIGVRAGWAVTRIARRNVLKANESSSFSAENVADFLPGTLRAQMSVSAEPPFNIEDYLAQLIQYPYGCIEQTSSRLWPLLYVKTPQALALGVQVPEKFDRDRAVQEGLLRLLGMQKSNGGFGFWDRNSPETPYMSVYVTDLLLDAREQGFAVSESALNQALNRLNEYLAGGINQSKLDYSDYYGHGAFALRAYAGYVLSRVDRASLSQLRLLADEQKEARSLLPMVHLAVALQKMGDVSRAQALLNNGKLIARNDEHWLGDYGSSVRDLAIAYRIGAKNKLDPGLLSTWIFDLDDRVGKRVYYSTQDLNALFFAGLELSLHSDKDWEAQLRYADKTESLNGSKALTRRFVDSEVRQGMSVTAGNTTLFARLTTVGVSKNPPLAIDNKMSIVRSYLTPDGKPTTIDQVKPGNLIVVKLEIKADQRVADALVVDLLPAGFELENQNLEGSVRLTDLFAKNKNDSSTRTHYYDEESSEGDEEEENGRNAAAGKHSNVQHVEYRDDRFVAALDVRSPYQTETLFYLMRAVTPGDYSVPAPMIESMYKPEVRSIGKTPLRTNIQ